MSATGASAMIRTDTAVRVISASPDRVFAALTTPTRLPCGYRRMDDRPVRVLRCAFRRVLPTGPGACGRHGRSPRRRPITRRLSVLVRPALSRRTASRVSRPLDTKPSIPPTPSAVWRTPSRPSTCTRSPKLKSAGSTAFSLGWTTPPSSGAHEKCTKPPPDPRIDLIHYRMILSYGWKTPDEAPSPSHTFSYGHCPETYDPRTG